MDLEKAINQCMGSSQFRNDRERPYNGQPHTDHGERGATLVEGLTMRDIADCIVQGFLAASGDPELQHKTVEISDEFKDTEYANTDTWTQKDLYAVDLSEIDPGAVIQDAMCFIEHYMGIFPNVPPLNINS